jgi:hypothetical protein
MFSVVGSCDPLSQMAPKHVLKEKPSTAFGPPFDDADADAILRSADQVDFHVYRVILSKSSPFFKSMFSLPQPDYGSSEKRPVVNVTENSRTINVLLAFIYPVKTEAILLNDAMDALSAARKYDMAAVSQRLYEKLANSKVVQDSPVEVFCVAYSHKLGEAGRIAAKASLKHRMSLDDIGDKLRYTNGPALHQLWKFHRACSATAAKAVSDDELTWIAKSDSTWWDLARVSWCQCNKHTYKIGTSRDTWDATTPWHNYITRAHNVLLQHPCAEAVAHDSVRGPSYSEKMCATCKGSLFGLPEFIRLLGEEVERRVSMVRHSLALFFNLSHSIALPKVDLKLPF